MSQKYHFKVKENQDKLRIDKFLVEEFSSLKDDMTRSKVQKLISEKCVFDSNNQEIEDSNHKVLFGQTILVQLKEIAAQNLQPKEIDFEIIFEDDDLFVINKPFGLTVHPGSGNQDNTLVNGLLFSHGKKNLSNINGDFRPGIVHRLDKDTSGLMLVAKNDFTHQALSNDLQARNIKRNYLAFIYGVLNPKKGKIDKSIARSRLNRLKMTVSKNAHARNAITNYETKEIFLDGFASLVECKLETGRTHQIRVHMESMKHSLIGDQTYGNCKKMLPKNLSDLVKNFSRQALHSYKIGFNHPRNGEFMEFSIDLAPDLKELYEALN
jgi:23S rRNA pseudouridine1911/1915/1917 synthase